MREKRTPQEIAELEHLVADLSAEENELSREQSIIDHIESIGSLAELERLGAPLTEEEIKAFNSAYDKEWDIELTPEERALLEGNGSLDDITPEESSSVSAESTKRVTDMVMGKINTFNS